MTSQSQSSGTGLAVRYLELVKSILTDTIHCAEPDRGRPDFGVHFVEHYFRGKALTCVPRQRLDHLESCIRTVVARQVPGDLIETGVWRGGCSIFMRTVLEALGVTDRTVWVADSYRGLPRPHASLFPRERNAYYSPEMENLSFLEAGLCEVMGNFAKFNLLDHQVRFLEGWFADTLPSAPIRQLAVLRLDGDFHDSTMVALTALYEKVSSGGFVIVDDYGEDWTHCREAVDKFRKERGIGEELHSVDAWCYYWQRA